MANATEQKTTTKDAGPKDVPAFRDNESNLFKLRRRDFPRNQEGRLAFCDYQVERWQDRKERLSKAADPNAKALKKLESMRKKMTELAEQLKAAGVEVDLTG